MLPIYTERACDVLVYIAMNVDSVLKLVLSMWWGYAQKCVMLHAKTSPFSNEQGSILCELSTPIVMKLLSSSDVKKYDRILRHVVS